MGSSFHEARSSLCKEVDAVANRACLHPMGAAKVKVPGPAGHKCHCPQSFPCKPWPSLLRLTAEGFRVEGRVHRNSASSFYATHAHLSHVQQQGKRAVRIRASTGNGPYRCHVTRVVPPLLFPPTLRMHPRIQRLGSPLRSFTFRSVTRSPSKPTRRASATPARGRLNQRTNACSAGKRNPGATRTWHEGELAGSWRWWGKCADRRWRTRPGRRRSHVQAPGKRTMRDDSEKQMPMLWIPKQLLEAVQCSGAFEDCKTFVDMPLQGQTSVEAATDDVLQAIPDGAEAVRAAVLRHFDEAGSDLDQPLSLSSHPRLDAGFPPGSVRCKWSQWLAESWTQLLRVRTQDQMYSSRTSSLLPLPYPMVIPAGRFRESYYWDSYWCALALDACGLHAEGAGALRNLLWTIRNYGIVPNGTRKYYMGRSQPPLLAAALEKMPHARESDTVQLLLKEYKSATSGYRAVRVVLEGGEMVTLQRYWSDTAEARPESFREDTELAQDLSDNEKHKLWRNISSACASGWDFSSRWMQNGFDLKSTCTTRVIPVDLNAFLLKMECAIATIATEAGNESTYSTFSHLAEQRRHAIDKVLWSKKQKRWQDRIMSEQDFELSLRGQPIKRKNLNCADGIFASDFVPLWCKAEASPEQALYAIESLEKSGLLEEGGLVASNRSSGQQWDFPNVWPPLVHMLVEGVAKHVDPDNPRSLDKQMATAFLQNAWQGWNSTGSMYEKYNGCKDCGIAGSGGEYSVQVGFGWTNAVVLLLLRDGYGRELDD